MIGQYPSHTGTRKQINSKLKAVKEFFTAVEASLGMQLSSVITNKKITLDPNLNFIRKTVYDIKVYTVVSFKSKYSVHMSLLLFNFFE